MKRFWARFFILIGPLLLGAFIGMMLSVLYPDSMKVASFLCPEDKPDTFVVRYNVQTSDGTGTNFTLYCMSERGETHEIGTWRPMLVLAGITVAVAYAIVILLVLWIFLRALFRRSDSGIPGIPEAEPPPDFGDPAPDFSPPD